MEESWRFDIGMGVAFGLAAYAWQAVQGEYALGFTLFVTIAVFVPPIMRLKARLRRARHRTAERAAAWAQRNPEKSKRLRWVVFPVIAGLWAFTLWALLT